MPSPLINPANEKRRCFDSFIGHFRRLLCEAESCTDKVIFVFLDAFGMRFYRRFLEGNTLLKRIEREGHVEECYAQFPSTTSCHTVTTHFGLPVGESGIFEWNYYEPLLEEMVSPLMFSYTGDSKRDTLIDAGISPKEIFPFPSFYRQLVNAGVPSYIFQNAAYANSAFSQVAFDGAHVYPYESEAQGIAKLTEVVNSVKGKGYFFLYLDSFDSAAHHFGPDSPEAEETLQNILNHLERDFVDRLTDRSGRTGFFLSADHGQVNIDPRKTIHLDREFAEAPSWFKTGRSGRALVPGGSSRDLFLYIKPDRVHEIQSLLSKRLDGIADVRFVSEMIEQGYFGSAPVSHRLQERLSDLVVLPYAGESVWWSEQGRYDKAFWGHHGGLTREEMEIPLLSMNI